MVVCGEEIFRSGEGSLQVSIGEIIHELRDVSAMPPQIQHELLNRHASDFHPVLGYQLDQGLDLCLMASTLGPRYCVPEIDKLEADLAVAVTQSQQILQ